MRVRFKSQPTYEEIKSLAIKLYLASKRASTTTPTDEELKLGGYWTKARLILQGKRPLPKHLMDEVTERVICPNCGAKLISSSLIGECSNCHKIGCVLCIGIKTFVDTGKEWKAYSTLRRTKEIPFKTLKQLPRKKLCRECLYMLDEAL
jgi:hypothetical protein